MNKKITDFIKNKKVQAGAAGTMFLVVIGYIADFMEILNSVHSSDSFFNIAIKWVQRQLSFPSVITRIIMILILVLSIYYLVIKIYKRNNSVGGNLGNWQLTKLLLSFVYIIFFAVLFIKSDNGGGPDISKNIGVIYDSNIINKGHFEPEIRKTFDSVIGRLGSNLKIIFHDVRGDNNDILSLDNFIKSNNIRYLVLSAELQKEQFNQLLNRGKNRFIAIKTIPFDIIEEDKSRIIALYLGAKQEVGAIIENMVTENQSEIYLIHPPKSSMSEYEKDFVASIKSQASAHDIMIKEFIPNQLSSVKNLISTGDSINKTSFVVIGSIRNNPDFNELIREINSEVFASNKGTNIIQLKSIPSSQIKVPLPWPSISEESIPFFPKLASSSVEFFVELDLKTTNENGVKENIKRVRRKMYSLYQDLELINTQRIIGTIDINEKEFPHLHVNNTNILLINSG